MELVINSLEELKSFIKSLDSDVSMTLTIEYGKKETSDNERE